MELEIQLDEIKEQYNNVIRNSNSKAQQKKMAFLERNLEQLTLVQKQVRSTPILCYHTLTQLQLVDQNSALKKEAGIAERKLLARNERIQNLESLLQDADRRLSIQNQRFEQQLDAVKQRLEQARGTFACSFWLRFTLNGIILFYSRKGIDGLAARIRPNPETTSWRRRGCSWQYSSADHWRRRVGKPIGPAAD